MQTDILAGSPRLRWQNTTTIRSKSEHYEEMVDSGAQFETNTLFEWRPVQWKWCRFRTAVGELAAAVCIIINAGVVAPINQHLGVGVEFVISDQHNSE